MIFNLFINVLTFTFFIFFGSHLTREIPLIRDSKWMVKILYGLLGSFMNLTFSLLNINDFVFFFNSSMISMILIYHYGGSLAALITGLCAVLYLLFKTGFSSAIVIVLGIVSFLIILFRVIDKILSNRWKKWCGYISGCLLGTVLLFIFKIYNEGLVQNLVVSTLSGIYVFNMIKMMEKTQTLLLKYKTEALYDYLTGLKNTRAFDIQFNKVAEESQINHQSFAVLMIDIDLFKAINDTYGHEVGDNILKEFGAILKSICRITDTVSRIGGEEFCLIINYCDKEKALMLGESIRKSVEEYAFYNNQDEEIHLTVSIGIAVYPDTSNDISELKSNADDAVYLAKHNGRNQVCVI